MLPLMAEQSEEQLAAMIDKAETWLWNECGKHLGLLIIDTISMAALYKDSYKPNEIIEAHQKCVRVACSNGIDEIHTDHFNKKEKDNPAGTLHKRNVVDQMLFLDGRKITLDKSRYGPEGMWNFYNTIPMDDGTGNMTLALEIGPTQYQISLQSTTPRYSCRRCRACNKSSGREYANLI
jgi:hypothetical protein